MPLDAFARPPRPARSRIAVIGGGISGLSAAWLLCRNHDVFLYERDGRLGGHANTVDVPVGDRVVPIDSAFSVYNEPAYPNLTALFAHLGIETEEACMSFGASIDGGAIEYSGQTVAAVFAVPRNIVSPKFWSMLADVPRFHRDARRALSDGLSHEMSLAEFCSARRYSRAFREYFLKPMAAAIWSMPTTRILDYSAMAFIKFYDNHGLLQVLDLPAWRTIIGCSRVYVEKISRDFAGNVRLSTGVSSVRRTPAGVDVRDETGAVDRFDEVIFACHPDQVLRVLAEPSEDERRILGAFTYVANAAFVHFDATQMPKRRRVWSSWNHIGAGDRAGATYWMNRAQNLTCERDIFVSINPLHPVRDELVVAEMEYRHPMFDVAAERAQREVWSLQGAGGIWFCGAYFGQGFHEDGLQAGLAVAEAIGGVRRPWSVANESGRIHLPSTPLAAARLAAE